MTPYSVSAHGSMLGDRPRMTAYTEAIRAAVDPGCTVLDLGTGSGIFAMLAARFGAARVYAVEKGDVVELARQLACDNRLEEKIKFIRADAARLTLPERVDVIVSDLRGVLPLFGRHLPTIVRARDALLKSDGRLIPQVDQLYVTVVEASTVWSKLTDPWTQALDRLDLKAGLQFVTNNWTRARLKPEQPLARPECWATLDYRSLREFNARGEVELQVEKDSPGHGLLVWFDSVLLDKIGFSNAPGQAAMVYSSAFFPWPETVHVRAGDTVRTNIAATLTGEDYVWRWQTRVRSPNGKQRAQFTQSTFWAAPLSAGRLRNSAPHTVPDLGPEGRFVCRVLSLMQQRELSLGEIARTIAPEFPDLFEREEDVLARVTGLATQFAAVKEQG